MPITDIEKDHDLLIELNTKVSFICKSMEELKESIKEIKLPCEEHTNCLKRISDLDDKIDSTPRWHHLILVVTFLSGILGSILLYNFQLDEVQFEKLDVISERVIKTEESIKFLNRR